MFKATYPIHKITIQTYDNPGWGIEVKLSDYYNKAYLIHEHISEENWFMQFVEGTTLTTIGDELKLMRIFHEVLNYFHIPLTPKLKEVASLLTFLQHWYTNECNGDWEHIHKVVHGYIDYEGKCQISIALNETYWEEEPFETVGSISTFQCRKEGAKFIGEGQLEHALFYLQTFKEWIEAFNIEVLHTYDGKLYISKED